jgi:uncharacterized protein YndB with AHSA1/START domain
METLHFEQDYAAPPEKVFAFLAEHENLSIVFAPMKVERLRDGDRERNGVGSVRRLSLKGLLPFEETITGVVPNERIEYRITKGTPLDSHFGVMRFEPKPDGGTHLDYTITIGARVPGLAKVIGAILNRAVSDGLRKTANEL